MIGLLKAIGARARDSLLDRRRYWISDGGTGLEVYCDQNPQQCLAQCAIARNRESLGHISAPRSADRVTEAEARSRGGTFCIIRSRQR